MSGSASRLALPVRQRTYKFALTPLADAMFQLLIFFMLSSSLTPYSLLTLQTAPEASDQSAAEGEETTTDAGEAEVPLDVALWTVSAESITVGGQAFGFDALGDLASALGSPAAPADVIIIVEPDAKVQDIATVLAALQSANVGSVQVATSGAG